MDPTPAEWLRARAPFVVAWSEFMDAPNAGGPFKALSELEETLAPLFAEEVVVTYMPWALANMTAAIAGDESVSGKLDGAAYEQTVQHYAARAYKSVLKALDKAKKAGGLDAFLDKVGAKPYLG